jgi:hypothetical protein
MLAALPQRPRKQTVARVGRIPNIRRVVLRPSHGLRSPFDSSRTLWTQSPTLKPLTAIVGHCMGRLQPGSQLQQAQAGCSRHRQAAARCSSQAAAASQSGRLWACVGTWEPMNKGRQRFNGLWTLSTRGLTFDGLRAFIHRGSASLY